MEEQTLVMELLSDTKKEKKRLFVMWLITFIALIGLGIYTIYLLNDIGTIETKQEIQDVDTIENSNINNGGTYGENSSED